MANAGLVLNLLFIDFITIYGLKGFSFFSGTAPDYQNPVLVQLYNNPTGAGNAIFLRPTVDDDEGINSGTGSLVDPFNSIYAALASVRMGQTLILLPGTYPPFVISGLRGTAEAPVHIQGIEEGAVHIHGSFQLPGSENKFFPGPLIGICDCKFLTLSYLKLSHGRKGIVIEDNCYYITLSHLRMEQIKGVGKAVIAPREDCHCIVQEQISVTDLPNIGCRKKLLRWIHSLELRHSWKYAGYAVAISWILMCSVLCIAYSNVFAARKDGEMMINSWVLTFFSSELINILIVQPLVDVSSLVMTDFFIAVLLGI